MKFYDTCALMDMGEMLKNEDSFLLSSISLQELEKLKTDVSQIESERERARNTIRILDAMSDKYLVVFYDRNVKKMLGDMQLDSSHNDYRICACAKYYADMNLNEVQFISSDISCRNIARSIFNLAVLPLVVAKPEEYHGYKEVVMNDEEMANFYNNLGDNHYSLLTNMYLIIKDSSGNIIDKYCWDGSCHQAVQFKKIENSYHNSIKPYKGDVYQQCALHSFQNNQITMIKGKAGTGKSYLSLGFLLAQLEKRRIDRIIVFCNPVAVRDAARLGFYPGSRDIKLLDSGIGNMLASKLGSSIAVEQMIQREELLLLPLSDIRGYDTSGSKAGIYITEAQNMNIDLMKLVLQRIGEDSICIVDGDFTAQVDQVNYAGKNNGMKRMSEVFRGQDFYGEVELQNIYRSRIAQVAEGM